MSRRPAPPHSRQRNPSVIAESDGRPEQILPGRGPSPFRLGAASCKETTGQVSLDSGAARVAEERPAVKHDGVAAPPNPWVQPIRPAALSNAAEPERWAALYHVGVVADSAFEAGK